MNQKQALEQAIELTDEILVLLDTAGFENLESIEQRRQSLIKQAFMESIEQIDLIRAEHLKNLNQQVVDKLTLFKQSVQSQQLQMRNASKATNAYRKHA